jgi:hypothetical protein
MSPMFLGLGTSGVELRSTPTAAPPQPGELPACVSAHTFDRRSWGGLTTIEFDVWLMGCNDAAGQLRLESGPTCEATSFLGAGQATCTATQDGSELKVVLHLSYPFGLNLLAGPPTTRTFWIQPGGSYRS